MNFEFVKDIPYLEGVYENCSNAEKLAMTMPMQSVFTSRKGAELLAKFIYMAAHKQQMEKATFADILSDQTFKEFVNSRGVMNAFHYIRKQGNIAAHGDVGETVEDAIDVLEGLHYIVGETACDLRLIDDYPEFQRNIPKFVDVKFKEDDEEKINNKALDMFFAYVSALDELNEDNQYLAPGEFDARKYSLEGNIEMHERLEFEEKPSNKELIDDIQWYFLSLLRLSEERSPERADEIDLYYPVVLDVKILIDGITYSSEDREQFEACLEKLLDANGFIIDCTCQGVLREYFWDDEFKDGSGRPHMIRKDRAWTGAGMLDRLEMYKRRENFDYKLSIFYLDSGGFDYHKIHDGKDIDIPSTYSEEILNKEFEKDWWSESLNLWVLFDPEEHPEIVEALHNLVRNTLPESEASCCEEAWEEDEPCKICSNVQWDCKSLREVQDFLDKVNEIILPIKDEVDGDGEGTWEIRSEFAVATWVWTDEGFKVMGTCL